jgi:hypothetical protein
MQIILVDVRPFCYSMVMEREQSDAPNIIQVLRLL